MDDKEIFAAGIIYQCGDRILLIKRADTGEWAFPAGHVEKGESDIESATRESYEEVDYVPLEDDMKRIGIFNGFSAFLEKVEEFTPTINDESTAFEWVKFFDLPRPMMPEAESIIQYAFTPRTELDYAREIAAGRLESPQRYENMTLMALRITGTGIAFRSKHEEFVYRNPDNYLNDEFIARCAALPVIWWHPENDVLDSEEYGKRVIGAIMFAYIIGDEVWGIARINDDQAISELDKQKLSTSPCFTFPVQCYNVASEEYPLMIEGKPVLLDHLAICAEGVWDKGGEPLGVNTQQPVTRSDSMDENPEQTPAATTAAPEGAVIALLQSIAQRLDRLEAAEAKEISSVPGASAVAGDPELGNDPVIAADNEGDMAKNVAAADEGCADESPTKELEDKVARSDSEVKDLKAQIKALEARMPRILSDADRNQLSEIQSRADKAASAFGETVAAPLPGESPDSYRRRCLDKFKQYSDAWKSIDLAKVAGDILGVAETAIYADAAAASKMPETYGTTGGLREIVKRQRGGGEIVEFVGNQSAWMGDFKAPGNKIAGFSKGF